MKIICTVQQINELLRINKEFWKKKVTGIYNYILCLIIAFFNYRLWLTSSFVIVVFSNYLSWIFNFFNCVVSGLFPSEVELNGLHNTDEYIHAYLQAHKHTYKNEIIQVKKRNVTCGYKRSNRIIKHFYILYSHV